MLRSRVQSTGNKSLKLLRHFKVIRKWWKKRAYPRNFCKMRTVSFIWISLLLKYPQSHLQDLSKLIYHIHSALKLTTPEYAFLLRIQLEPWRMKSKILRYLASLKSLVMRNWKRTIDNSRKREIFSMNMINSWQTSEYISYYLRV